MERGVHITTDSLQRSKRLPTAEMESGNAEPEANEHAARSLRRTVGGSEPPLLLLSQSVTPPGRVVSVY